MCWFSIAPIYWVAANIRGIPGSAQLVGLFFVYLLKITIMKKDIDPELKDVLIKVGEQVRKLRKTNSDKGYASFAKEIQEMGVQVSKNTLYRLETGNGDYDFLSLVSILKHFDVKVSDFFGECGL